MKTVIVIRCASKLFIVNKLFATLHRANFSDRRKKLNRVRARKVGIKRYRALLFVYLCIEYLRVPLSLSCLFSALDIEPALRVL